jgi:hypothetical protein
VTNAKQRVVSPAFLAFRAAMKRAFVDPAIAPSIPPGIRAEVEPALLKDVSTWDHVNDKSIENALKWALKYL